MRALGLSLATLVAAYAGDNTVVIYASYDHEPPPEVASQMQSEAASILAPAGYKLDFRPLARRGETVGDLVLITFHGRCDATCEPQRESKRMALGWTHISDGVVLPFTEVHCERVHSMLWSRIRAVAPEKRRMLLGRALGRVVAHELYHVFIHAKAHGRAGVAKRFYSADELIRDTFRFTGQDFATLKRSANTN